MVNVTIFFVKNRKERFIIYCINECKKHKIIVGKCHFHFPKMLLARRVFTMAKNQYSKSANKSVRVNGYTRKDGTYVAPYTRSMPNR